MIIILSAVLFFTLVFSAVGCNSSESKETEKQTETPTKTPADKVTGKPTENTSDKATEKPTEKTDDELSSKTYNISDDYMYFKLIGRMQDVDDGVSCDFTASGIEFDGVMTGEVVLSLSCDRNTYFTLYIDGVRSEERLFADSSTSELTLTSFEGEQTHNIRLLKQTEPQWSLSVLKEISITGHLDTAPEKKDIYIEFIGDSITCGYGNLGDSSSPNPGTALWEDGTRAYAFMTAEALDADYSIVGCSGIGIDKGHTGFSESDFYQKTSFYRDRNGDDYSFFRIPDLVVINLGTNDQSCGSTEEDFKAGVRALINYIRDSYGKDIPIVWAYNMMGNGRFDWTRTVLEDMGGEANGLYSVQLNQNHEGGNGHPNLAAQKLASETLAEFIGSKEILVK